MCNMKCKHKLPRFLFQEKDQDGKMKIIASSKSIFRDEIKSNLTKNVNNYTSQNIQSSFSLKDNMSEIPEDEF